MTPSLSSFTPQSLTWRAPSTTTAQLDHQFLNAIRVKPDCLPSVPAAVVARLKKDGLL